MPELTMIEAIRGTLAAELARDERVMVLGQDVGRLGGVFRATEGLQSTFGASRVVDTPLAEGAIVGASVGLAIAGQVPVAEIQFLGFTHQAYHQIVDQAARYRYRSRGRFALPITIRTPFGGGVRTPEMHSDPLEAHYANVPGLKVVLPATPYDAKGLLAAAIRDPDPVLYLEPLRGYRLISGEVPDEDYTVPIGKARIAREGTDVTLVAWSAAVSLCEKVAERAAADGISCAVVDVRSISPLDVDTIAGAVERTGRAVVVHEASATGGFGGEIVATLQEEVFYALEAPILRVTGPDTPYPPFVTVEDHYLPSEQRVLSAVKRTVTAA